MASGSEGRVTHERFDHILKITIDNVANKNAFSPEMMAELSDALTLLDQDEGLWVGVLCAAGGNFTAGLDMPKFFGPDAAPAPAKPIKVKAPPKPSFKITRVAPIERKI